MAAMICNRGGRRLNVRIQLAAQGTYAFPPLFIWRALFRPLRAAKSSG
jgi:hypothetical protein